MPELQDVKVTAVNKRLFILVYKQPYPVTAKRVSLQCMSSCLDVVLTLSCVLLLSKLLCILHVLRSSEPDAKYYLFCLYNL